MGRHARDQLCTVENIIAKKWPTAKQIQRSDKQQRKVWKQTIIRMVEQNKLEGTPSKYFPDGLGNRRAVAASKEMSVAEFRQEDKAAMKEWYGKRSAWRKRVENRDKFDAEMPDDLRTRPKTRTEQGGESIHEDPGSTVPLWPRFVHDAYRM